MSGEMSEGENGSHMFQGASCGALSMGAILDWYDQPITFLARDAERAVWLVVMTDDDREKKTSCYVLAKISDEETQRLEDGGEGAFFSNRVMRDVILRDQGAIELTVDWHNQKVISERRMGVEEAMEHSVGDINEAETTP